MAEELKFTLIENAEDFLREALHYVVASEPRDWKYAILHLCSALELLLKAILEKEHWSLLFEDVERASRQALHNGNIETVRFETALTRLQNIVGITFESKSLTYLRQLRRHRNWSNHFSLQLNVEQAKSLVAHGIVVFLTLEQRYLHSTPDRSLEYEINQTLHGFEKYVNERLRDLRLELDTTDRPPPRFRMCMKCLQETLILEESWFECLFCGETWSFHDFAEYYGEGTGGYCPSCHDGVQHLVIFNNDEAGFICARCGFETEEDLNTACSRCGQKFWDDYASSVCSDCLGYMMEKD